MRSAGVLIKIAIAAAIAFCLILPSSVNAATTRYYYHHHHVRYHSHFRHYHVTNQFYDRTNLTNQFGTYPNIQYFTRDGHVYYRNLETGEVNLSQW